jgi:hypothetical protein
MISTTSVRPTTVTRTAFSRTMADRASPMPRDETITTTLPISSPWWASISRSVMKSPPEAPLVAPLHGTGRQSPSRCMPPSRVAPSRSNRVTAYTRWSSISAAMTAEMDTASRFQAGTCNWRATRTACRRANSSMSRCILRLAAM